MPRLCEGGSAGLRDSLLSARKSEYLQRSRWWDQFILLQNILVEAGHSVQGTHAGVNACLRLQRAWSNSSAEGDPSHLSQRLIDDSGTSMIRYFIAGPTEENRGWDRVPKLTAGVYKGSLPTSCQLRGRMLLYHGSGVAAESPSCMLNCADVLVAAPPTSAADWGKASGKVFSCYSVTCHCKTVCVTLPDFPYCTALMVNNVSLIISAMGNVRAHCVSLERK